MPQVCGTCGPAAAHVEPRQAYVREAARTRGEPLARSGSAAACASAQKERKGGGEMARGGSRYARSGRQQGGM